MEVEKYKMIYEDKDKCNNDHLKIKMILSKVCTNKRCMLKGCSSLIKLNNDEKDISFDNDNILFFVYNNKDTNNNDNNSLLDISKWKILNSIDMNKMFYNCFSVNYINYLNDNYLS